MKIGLSSLVVLFFSTLLMAYSGGSGTEEDPYQIATLSDLQQLSNTSSDWDKHFIQTTDIDASATINWDDGAGFNPIASDGINFSGSYDGQSHIIDQLYINRPTKQYTGLFSYIGQHAEVRNLGLTNVNITGGQQTGALTGINANYSVIENCYSTGNVHGDQKVGGFAGENYYHASISNCYTTCEVIADTYDYSGGFIALNFSNSTITNCYSTGSVEGYEYVGGFVGGNNYLSTISDCYSTGNVFGEKSSGGFIGLNSNSSALIQNCYCTGDVTRKSGSTDLNFAGFSGWNNELIQKCYSTGSVFYEGSAAPTNKGFSAEGSGTYSDNFFDSEASNQSSDIEGSAEPKTTDEMKNVATFTDLTTTGLSSAWDFVGNPYDDSGTDDNWDIDRSAAFNNGYPYLTWQSGGPSAINDQIFVAKQFTLKQNFPNPFNPTTSIRYHIAKQGNVQLIVYNALGQKVATLVNQKQAPGQYTVNFDASRLASGVYYYRLKTGNRFTQTKKMILMK